MTYQQKKKGASKKKSSFSYSKMILSKDSEGTYRTPIEAYQALNAEFHFTQKEPSRTGNWGKRVFKNAYLDSPFWIVRALEQIKKNHTALAVFLLKDDLSTAVYHDYVIPYASEIRAIRGRLKFGQNQKGNAPFGSVVAIFRAGPRIARFKNLSEVKEKKAEKKKVSPKRKKKPVNETKLLPTLPVVDGDLLGSFDQPKEIEGEVKIRN